ncbi:unnamed protein product, partial [Dovyalis caffra]
ISFSHYYLWATATLLSDNEVLDGLQYSIIRMENDQQVQSLINDQVNKFCHADDYFQEYVVKTIKTVDPAQFWSAFGNHCSEIRGLAIPILSQTCDGAVRYRINRNLAEKL